MTHNVGGERRKHPRVYLPAAASLFCADTKLGDYLVRDLSAGGALFTGGPAVAEGTQLRAVLVGPGVEGVALSCSVRRSDGALSGSSSVAVEFEAVAAQVQALLEGLVSRALERRGERAIVVVHPLPLVLASLGGDIADLGRRVMLATTPLETIHCLYDLDTTVEAICIDQSYNPDFGREIIKVVREDFPAVRRIALFAGINRNEVAEALAEADVSDVLDIPWTPSALAASLGVDPRSETGRPSTSSAS